MNAKTLLLAATAIGLFAATAASAAVSIDIGQPAPVHNAPGPRYIPYHPYYFDPYHAEADYRYWQVKRAEKVQARNDHYRQVYIVKHGVEPPVSDYIPQPYPPYLPTISK